MKRVVFWVILIVAVFLLWQITKMESSRPAEISYSEFLSQVEAGNVAKVNILGNEIRGSFRNDSKFRVTAPCNQEGMLQALHQKNVEIWVSDTGGTFTLLINLSPFLLLVWLWFLMYRQMKTLSQALTQMASQRPSIG